jgi:hypothetical protein
LRQPGPAKAGRYVHLDARHPVVGADFSRPYAWTPGASWPVRFTYSTYDPG